MAKFFLTLPFALAASVASGQIPPTDVTEMLVRKLGSDSFQVREAAAKALRDRPDAVSALRDAVRCSDLETGRRAAGILDFLEREPVREVHGAIKEGRAERAIKMLAAWPAGKYEGEAWDAAREFARALIDSHQKRGGKNVKPQSLGLGNLPIPIIRTQINETGNDGVRVYDHFFIRARQVDLDYSRGNTPITYFSSGVIVAAGSVRTSVEPAISQIVFAGGDVEIHGCARNLLIVSCANVRLKCDVGGSLVIAKGEVKCDAGHLRGVRIICGTSATYAQKNIRDCIISENDPNPLGFIRWSDAPKDKAAPKAK